MKALRVKNGFTLIELMITTAAAAVLMLVATAVILMAFRAWHTNHIYAELRRDCAQAFVLLTRDVRESSFDGLDADSAGGFISATRSWDNTTVTYQQVGDTLEYNEGNGPIRIIPANVQQFTPTIIPDTNSAELLLVLSSEGITITNEVFVSTRN